MKGFLFILALAISGNLHSQSFINYPGYIIFKNGDTLFTKLRVDSKIKNVEFSNLFKAVLFYNKQNQIDTAFADDTTIVGYGFKKDTSNYYFHRLVLNSMKNKPGDKYPIFAWCISNGPLKLFAYGYDVRTEHFAWSKTLYHNLNPDALTHEYTRNRRIKYYFKKNEEDFTAVAENSDNSPQVKWLKAYFKDYSSLSEKIGKEINAFDLETIVNIYNDWYKKKSMETNGN
jgi:hypothetical protein